VPTLYTTWLFASEMYRFEPVRSRARPTGLRVAELAQTTGVPPPAGIRTTRLLPWSATYKLPAASRAMPVGVSKGELALTPEEYVLTVPVVATFRIELVP